MNTTLYLDREEASTILKVSTRTIDRYLRKYRFKTKKEGRTILIKREDVDKIIQEQIGHLVDPATLTPNAAPSNLVVKDIKVESVKEPKESRETRDEENQVYKSLYVEVKKDLKEKQERLEAATYRVGQLESQVKNMVPMLDYTRKEKELKELQINLEQQAVEKEFALNQAEKRVRTERMAKWIYLSLAGLLLVAEPILFMVWAFS